MLQRIVKFVEGLIDRDLESHETLELKKFVKTNQKFVSDNTNDIVAIAELADAYADLLNERKASDRKESFEPPEETSNDIKEESESESNKTNEDIKALITTNKSSRKPVDTVNRQNLNLVKFMGIDNFDRFISEINPAAKRKRAYMCLDSRYAKFNDTCTKLTWEFTNNLNVVNNSTNVTGPVRDITWIRMHSIVVRKFSSIPQRSTILIEELSAQSFILPGGRRFHFVGLLNDLQNPINYGERNVAIAGQGVPDFTIFDKYELLAGYRFNDGFYRFNKPITTLENITISIGNPDQLVVIPKYEFFNVQVTDATDTYIDLLFNEPHNYIANNSVYTFAEGTWYSVFVNEFTGGTSDYNSFMNSREFTTITILSTTTIRIGFANSSAGFHVVFTMPFITGHPAPADYPKVRIRFNSYRVIMNFEMEYISV